MLKLKDLEEMGTVSFGNAQDITLKTIKAAIGDLAERNGVPVAFYFDEAKEGGMLSNVVNTLMVYHPEHRKDYYNMALVLHKQGNFGSVAVFAAGTSKQMNKFYRSEKSKEAVGAALKGGGSGAVGAAIGGALGSLGKNKAKLQEEQLYYEIILELIGTALNE